MIETFFDWVIDLAAPPLCVGVVLAILDFLRACQRWAGVKPARDTTGAAFDPIDCAVDMLLKAALQAELGPHAAGHSGNDAGRRLNNRRDDEHVAYLYADDHA